MISLSWRIFISGCLLTLLSASVAGTDDITTALEDQGIYVCHPPMEQLLVGRKDISKSALFNSAKAWAEEALTNISTNADSVSFSVFGPSGDPIYQKRLGLLRSNETRTVDSDTIYRVARYNNLTFDQFLINSHRLLSV